jgi:hypothetical protein
MAASMRAHEGNQYIHRGEIYREPLSDEISEPEEFTAKYQPSPNSSKQPSIQLNPGQGDTDMDFGELRSQFARPKTTTSPTGPQNNSSGHTRITKGKGKESNLRLSEEDYPRLQQQWNEEFANILGGTKDKLPP